MMDLKRWKIFRGLDPSLISNCKFAKFLRYPRVGFLVLQNDEVHAVTKRYSDGAIGSVVSKVESLSEKGIVDFYGCDLGFSALSKSGCVYSWSHRHDRESYRGNDVKLRQVCFPDDVKGRQVCQVSCGYNHKLCLTADGLVFGWGSNRVGQLGSGGSELEYERDAIKITGLGDDIVQVAAGFCSSFTLDSAGRVWFWGSNISEFGHDEYRNSTSTRNPRIIENLDNIKKIAAGAHHVLALSEIGELYFWGNFGPTSTHTSTPTKITTKSMQPVTDIGSTVMASSYAVFQTKDTVYLWGICAVTPTMLRPIAVNVQPHRVEDAWKGAFDDSSTSDLVFLVDNEKLHAHAAFLKLRSEYFRKMFDSDWAESKRGASPIEIKGFSFRVFKAFVYFLYNESLMDSDTMAAEDLAELMRAADYYGNDDLRVACEKKLKSLLNPQNACFVYACAEQSNAQNLQDYAADFMAPVFNEVVKSADFAKLDNERKTKLMIHLAELNVFQVPKKRRLQ